MKTYQFVLFELVSLLACAELLGQASFRCTNYDYDSNFQVVVNAPVYDWTGNLLSGPDWRAELYGGATVDSLSPVIDFYSGDRGMAPFYRPGYFRRTDGAGDLAVFAVPVFGWAWLQVKVWDVTLGTTYEEAVARGLGGYGESSLFYARGGDPGVGSIPSLPGPLIGLQSFSVLQPIPEPATGALLALGGLGLWWATRRRQGGQP